MENKHNHEKEEIKRNVFIENELRKILNNITPIILKELKQYLNKKIVKIDDSLIKEIEKNHNINIGENKSLMDNLEDDLKPIINQNGEKGNKKISYFYVSCEYGLIYLNLKICFNGGSYEDEKNNKPYCFYYEKRVYLGNFKNQILTELRDYEKEKILNVEEELKIFEKAIKLNEELEEEKNKFGLYNFKDLVK